MSALDPEIVTEILAIVDGKKPGSEEVWLTGSRARGQERPDSNWDIVAIHPQVHPILPGHSGPVIKEKEQLSTGHFVEVVYVPPSDWDHPGRYMTDCRAFGIRLR